jgi:hypothetical protein
MTGMKCRILPYAAADGPANMALDEALLAAVATGSPAAYLRCYGWSVPTLSLGYFQRLAEIRAGPRQPSPGAAQHRIVSSRARGDRGGPCGSGCRCRSAG